MTQIEPDFFIVNVAHGQPKHNRFSVLKTSDFPVANRQKPQTVNDVKEYLKKYKHLKNYDKYANFHLLLYLAKVVDIHVS